MDNIERLKNFIKDKMFRANKLTDYYIKDFANLDCYYTIDTESCRDIINNDNERVYAWSISNTYNDDVIYGYSLDELLDFLIKFSEKKKYLIRHKNQSRVTTRTTFFCHNLGWDIEFFKYFLNDKGFKYYSKILYDDDSVVEEKLEENCFTITENNGQTYNSTIRLKLDNIIKNGNEIQRYSDIMIYDSFKIVPNGLDEIARKVINIDEMFYKLKDDYDYDKIRNYDEELTDIELCYIYNDVYILKEFLKQYYIQHNLQGKTASGISFNNLLNFKYPKAKKKYEEFEKTYPKIHDRKAVDIINKSYNGGYTTCNSQHKGKDINKYGLSIDINSSYPSNMQYKKLPYGIPRYFKGKVKLNDEYDIGFQTIHFDAFKRKNGSNIGFIKIGKCKNFLFDIKNYGYKKVDYVATNIINNEIITYNYELTLTIDELKLFDEIYDFYTFDKSGIKNMKHLKKGYEYVEGLSFKSMVGDFAEFIDDCMKRKIKGKKEGNEIMTLIAKTDANSVYGKLGSSFERDIKILTLNRKGIYEFTRKYENDNDCDYEEDRHYYRAYASFTTSYGRLNLFNSILEIETKFGSENFVYCDTDSIYATITYEQLLQLNIEFDKYKLGAWDIEKEFLKIKSLGAKKYMIYGKDFNSYLLLDKHRKNTNKLRYKTYICNNKNFKKKYEKYHLICKCAGLPSEVRKEMTFENFHIGSKFYKKQKKKVYGGYRLEMTTFEIKDFTFY